MIFRNRLHEAGFDIGQSESPIFPIMVRDNKKVYESYDYWFSDIAKEAAKCKTSKEQFVSLMCGLQDALQEKSVMQELLRWEIAEGNEITNRTATLREMFTLPLADKYRDLFAETSIDIVALASMLIGGLYYLNLHKERATFCHIDLRKEEDCARIKDAVKIFSDIMFSALEKKDTKLDVAERMRARGIDEQTIKECLQI